MAIRLVALDMDGTLLNSGKELPPDFLPWVKAHPDILTVIGSGRPRGGLRDYFDENLQMVYLCDNGAMVYRGEQLLFSQPMPLLHVSSILTFLAGHQGVVPVISSAGCAYVPEVGASEWREIHRFYRDLKVCHDLIGAARQDPVAKVALYLPKGNSEEFARELDRAALPVLHACSGKEWIDLMEPGVNKGSALRQTMDRMGIARGECMAFGDYMNDIEMLRSADFSFAMGNATQEVKNVCRFVTSSNDEDGVMRILRGIGPDGKWEEIG